MEQGCVYLYSSSLSVPVLRSQLGRRFCSPKDRFDSSSLIISIPQNGYKCPQTACTSLLLECLLWSHGEPCVSYFFHVPFLCFGELLMIQIIRVGISLLALCSVAVKQLCAPAGKTDARGDGQVPAWAGPFEKPPGPPGPPFPWAPAGDAGTSSVRPLWTPIQEDPQHKQDDEQHGLAALCCGDGRRAGRLGERQENAWNEAWLPLRRS